MPDGPYPPERQGFTDPTTGRSIIRWTASPAKDQHLYFTSPSVTNDDRWLVMLSERDGHPNLYAIDRGDGTIRRLSDNRAGLLFSYVYAIGGMAGLSKASPCLDPVRGMVYAIIDQAVWRFDLAAETSARLWDLPREANSGRAWVSAFNHVSPDGRTLCVPLADPRAFADGHRDQGDQLRDVPLAMRAHGYRTRLYAIDTESGAAAILAEAPFWVTHVQYDPMNTGRLIFNSEGKGSYQVEHRLPRIWVLAPGGTPRPLFDQAPAEYAWCCHENWTPDGRGIVYHGERWKQAGHGGGGAVSMVAIRDFDGRVLFDANLPVMRYGHATPMPPDGRSLVVDGIEKCVSLLSPETDGDWAVMHLCRHDSSMCDQDAHAHPLATANGASIVFTSDREGSCNVYEVMTPDLAGGVTA